MSPDLPSVDPTGSRDSEGNPPKYARLVIRNAEGAVVTKDVLRHTTLLGSQAGCNIQLVSPEIAPVHCALTLEQDGLHVRQIRGTYATRLNGAAVDAAPLADGDELQLGPFCCRFETNLSTAPPAEADLKESRTIGGENAARFARLMIRNRDGAVVRKDLTRHTTLIGGMQAANVQLLAPEVSPAHCLITRESGGLRIRDLRSRCGTRINGRPMEICWLKSGDQVEIGPFVSRLETNLIPPAIARDDDCADPRFEFAGLVPPMAEERAELEQARALLDRRSAELAEQQQRLDEARAEIESLRNAAQEELESARREREDVSREQSALAAERERIAQESSRLKQEQITLHAERKRLAQFEQEQKEIERELEAAQQRLEEQVRQLDASRDEHVRERDALREEREQFLAKEQTLAAERERLLIEQKQAEDAGNRFRTELQHLSRLEEQARQTAADLRRQQDDLARRESARAEAERNLEHQVADFNKLRAALDAERTQFDQRSAAWERERTAFEQARERYAVESREVSRKSSRATALQAELEAEGKRLAALDEQLQAGRRDLQAEQERLDAERDQLTHRANELTASQATLQREKEEFQRELERASQTGADLARERLIVSQERTRLEKDLHEIEAITGRLRADREQLETDQRRVAAELEELDRQRESLARQEAAMERAAADLQERHENLLHRRQQLRAEQTFLRSGKRQFQGALHEFRAEQERFRRAVSTLKPQRKALRRQRREVRAAMAAGTPIDQVTIPFQSAWISPGWLRGMTEGDGDAPRLIDVGETGYIFLAEEMATGRPVALKIIPAPQADAAGRRDIELRWKSMLPVNHPNVVRSLRIDSGGTALCLVMEPVEGINLFELISLHGALTWREAAGYAFQAALGLQAIHESGQLHGNVCPSHGLVEEDGTLQLLAGSVFAGWSGSNLPTETPGDDPPETVDYIAPERTLDSAAVDHRADIYGLGCMLYHAIAGTAPFPGGTALERIEAHRTKLPLPLRRFAPDVPKDLILAVKKMMAKQPQDRYQTADEAAQAIAPFVRRVPAWYNNDLILASRIDRIRERLVSRLTRDVLSPTSRPEDR